MLKENWFFNQGTPFDFTKRKPALAFFGVKERAVLR
jgi:hypothetical protein